MEIQPVLFLGGGVLVLGFGLWSYLGRSRAARWWAAQRGPMGMWHEQAVLAMWPGGGVLAVIFGVDQLLRESESAAPVSALIALPALLIALGGGLRIPIPRWWMPRWYREMKPPKQKRPKKQQRNSAIDLWGPE